MASFARLGLFVLVSLVAGMLVAGAALPFVGGAGVATRTAIESYESLPSQLTTPPLPQRSRILAADGSVLATIYEQNRIEVPLTAVAPVMRQAIVAVEDGRFYEHRGVDPRGIIRAFVGNSTGGSAAAGGGGSTLTQQYVKNVFVESASTPEEAAAARARTYIRKLKEMRYALALERVAHQGRRSSSATSTSPTSAPVPTASRPPRCATSPSTRASSPSSRRRPSRAPCSSRSPTTPRATRSRRRSDARRCSTGWPTSATSRPALATASAAIPTKKFLKPSKVRNGCTTSYAPFFCDYVYRQLRTDPAFGKTPAARDQLLKRGGLTIRTTLVPDDAAGRAGLGRQVHPAQGQEPQARGASR